MSRDLSALNPRFAPQAQAFVDDLRAQIVRFVILETRRAPEVQAAYYAQGRESYETVCAKREAAKLSRIGREEAGRIITWTLKSKHLDGLALDVAPLTAYGLIPWLVRTEAQAALWRRVGEIGEAHGLEWGGRWTYENGLLGAFDLGRDLPHFEYKEA
jgi:peptidoglycan LD-endopeptidase CwlK